MSNREPAKRDMALVLGVSCLVGVFIGIGLDFAAGLTGDAAILGISMLLKLALALLIPPSIIILLIGLVRRFAVLRAVVFVALIVVVFSVFLANEWVLGEPFRQGFRRKVTAQVTPEQLESAAAELLQRQAHTKDRIRFRGKDLSSPAVPEPIRRLRPTGVDVQYSYGRVVVGWGGGWFFWGMRITPSSVEYFGP